MRYHNYELDIVARPKRARRIGRNPWCFITQSVRPLCSLPPLVICGSEEGRCYLLSTPFKDTSDRFVRTENLQQYDGVIGLGLRCLPQKITTSDVESRRASLIYGACVLEGLRKEFGAVCARNMGTCLGPAPLPHSAVRWESSIWP